MGNNVRNGFKDQKCPKLLGKARDQEGLPWKGLLSVQAPPPCASSLDCAKLLRPAHKAPPQRKAPPPPDLLAWLWGRLALPDCCLDG